MSARITPAEPPFPDHIKSWIDRTMPAGVPPLVLFTTLARDPRLCGKFFAGSLLDRGHLTLRQRELVIDRTTALCGSEYEWGVHIARFGKRVGLTDIELRSIVHGSHLDACWNEEERALIQLCDALHRKADVDDDLWGQLRVYFSEVAMLELLLLAGAYHTVSYLTNALRLPLEPWSERFPRPHSIDTAPSTLPNDRDGGAGD